MIRAIRFCVVAAATVGGFGASAMAQAPAPQPAQPASAPGASSDPSALWQRRNAILLKRWEPLLGEIYAMNDEQKAKLTKLLAELSDEDIKYQRDNTPALNKARDDVMRYAREMSGAQGQGKSAEERQKLAKLQQDAQTQYQTIQGSAPFALDRLAERIEKTLPPAQAAAGHKVFIERKPYGLRPPPAPAPKQPVVNPQAPVTPPMPTDPRVANPTRFRKVTRVAPPIERWPLIAERIIGSRNYAGDQVTRAKAILADLMKRAQEDWKSIAADVAAAGKLTDAVEREKKLRTLCEPIDVTYDELIERLNQLARSDQMGTPAGEIPAAAPAVERWLTVAEKTITARFYNDVQAGEARKLAAAAIAEGEKYLQAHAAEFTKAGDTADANARGAELDKLYGPLDKTYGAMVAAVERIGPAPTPPGTMGPVSPAGAAGGH